MTQMVNWPKACAGAIISLFNDSINMLGRTDTSYAKYMTSTLQQGIYLSYGRK